MNALLTHALTGGHATDIPQGQRTKSDPWDSGMWDFHREDHLGNSTDWVFDPGIMVLAPKAAEDVMHVPIMVDAADLGTTPERMVVTIDYSPIPKVLSYFPGRAAPVLGFGVKYEVGSVLRASLDQPGGAWAYGGANIHALGGGCTAPAAAHARPDWQEGFSEMRGRLWAETGRTRLWTRHP
ncbi:MAG: thiosulfate oxidation carrier protein SoxY [Pseudomonadota bacterium]